MTSRRALAVPFLGTLALAGLPLGGAPLREARPFDDFTLREEMVAMRDGAKLYTLILTPKKASAPLPILLMRTPYDATRRLGSRATSRLAATQGQEFFADGDYVVVIEDVRGRFKSEGDYVMYRPPVGPFNPTPVDESTDAWDTIDWLVKNVPSNGRVGLWGTSYPGWLTLAGLRDPHPALAAAVPFNPVVDGWKADDWFHWGAFRAVYDFDFIHAMESRPGQFVRYPYESYDLYRWALSVGNLSRGLTERLDARHKMWARLIEFPSYGPFWRAIAADQWFTSPPKRLVPTLHVHGFFDQEDIYGSPAVYAALEAHDKANDRNFFVAGPWYHGQHWADGSHLGAIVFDEDTAKRFREDVLRPFLRRFLHGDPVSPPAPVTVFETGTNRWRTFDRWPPGTAQVKRLYLQPGGRLAFEMPTGGELATAYVSDPAKPVPYAPRPLWGFDSENPAAVPAWRRWLVEDQRFVDGRPDVATWMSEPLAQPVTVRGPVVARLFAETTGTDADWVVKLIDVFPDEHPEHVEMSGYELMVSADVFRGRYRESLEAPHALLPATVLAYAIPLPHLDHCFRPGHRIMVQVQSTWFPLYDLNPQKFVPRIHDAAAGDYQAATQKIHHSPRNASHLELLVEGQPK